MVLPALRRAAPDARRNRVLRSVLVQPSGRRTRDELCLGRPGGAVFEQVVPFEQFLVDDGIHLIKIWLSVGREEQARRLSERRQDPLKQWKLSALDEQGPTLWEDYTLAALELFSRTDTPETPWWFVNNNNKRVGRLNVLQHVLNLLPYESKDASAIGDARRDIVAPVRALLPMIAPDR